MRLPAFCDPVFLLFPVAAALYQLDHVPLSPMAATRHGSLSVQMRPVGLRGLQSIRDFTVCGQGRSCTGQ